MAVQLSLYALEKSAPTLHHDQTNFLAAADIACRRSHGIYNHTQAETRWFNFNCAKSRHPTPGQSADATDLGVEDQQNAYGRREAGKFVDRNGVVLSSAEQVRFATSVTTFT